MVRRARHSDGHPFFGCPRYPDCRGARGLDGQESGNRSLSLFDAAFSSPEDGLIVAVLVEPDIRRRVRTRDPTPTGPVCPFYLRPGVPCGSPADRTTGFCPDHRPRSAGPAPAPTTVRQPEKKEEPVNPMSFVEID